jgi:dephospho-CoA kinase
LLFETDFYKLCDYTVCVYVDMDSQIRRIMYRDNITFPEAINKINAQMPLKEKVEKADFVIDNCHSEGDIDWQLHQLLKKLKD